jgi:hypothetical protein
MMEEKEYCEDIYPEIYDHEPILLSARAMLVFPALPLSVDKNSILAGILCNLTGYYLDHLLFLYFPSDHDPETENYLISFAGFLKHENLQRTVGNWAEEPFDIKESAVSFIDKIRKFPPPPACIHVRLRTIYEYIQKVFLLVESDGTDFLRGLYNLSVSWAEVQTRPSMYLGPASYILKSAEHQNKKFACRQSRTSYLFYAWGKEYDEYYQEFLNNGCSEKTSRKHAGIKFSKNHPFTGNANRNQLPGKSLNSLKKYQKIYQTRSQEDA